MGSLPPCGKSRGSAQPIANSPPGIQTMPAGAGPGAKVFDPVGAGLDARTMTKTTRALTTTRPPCRSQFVDRVFDGSAFDRAVTLCIAKKVVQFGSSASRTRHANCHRNSRLCRMQPSSCRSERGGPFTPRTRASRRPNRSMSSSPCRGRPPFPIAGGSGCAHWDQAESGNWSTPAE